MLKIRTHAALTMTLLVVTATLPATPYTLAAALQRPLARILPYAKSSQRIKPMIRQRQ